MGVLVFLFLAITCFVKFHPETLVVLFAADRDQLVALIVKEQAFVQSGWKNLLHPSGKNTAEMVDIGFKLGGLKLYYTSFCSSSNFNCRLLLY